MHTEIESSLNLAKQIILCGPPGTGKTYLAKEFVERHWILPPERYAIVQFHPAYNYTLSIQYLRFFYNLKLQ